MLINKNSVIVCAAAVALTLTATVAHAASIGINFGSDRDASAFLDPVDVAGVVAQANWNNAPNADGSIVNANDDSGAATSLDISWDGEGTWQVGGSPDTKDGELMYGFVGAENTLGIATLSIGQIPYEKYALYVYVSHDRTPEDTLFSETGGAFPDFLTVEDVTSTTLDADPFSFNEITTYGGSGNFFKTDTLQQTSLEIVLTTNDSSNRRGPIAALQIVEIPVPEPGTFALSALGLFSLILVRLRRRK